MVRVKRDLEAEATAWRAFLAAGFLPVKPAWIVPSGPRPDGVHGLQSVIVGLRSKGRLDVRASMLASGFAKPAVPISLGSTAPAAWSPVATKPVQVLAA